MAPNSLSAVRNTWHGKLVEKVNTLLDILRDWAKNGVRVAVSYGNLDRYGSIVAVDELGLVLRTSQGDVCLLWHAVKQVRPTPE